MNSIIIFGSAIGVGLQFFISSYSKGLVYCKLDGKGSSSSSTRAFIGSATGTGSGTVISSLFSFFSLVPLGCCGSWLLILSFLPSIFGGSLSVALIQYSKPVSYIGIVIVFGFAALSAFKLQRELKHTKKEKMFKSSRRRIHGLDLKLFIDNKPAPIIATLIIIIISIVIIAMIILVRTNSNIISPSYPNTSPLNKENRLLLSSSPVIGQSNAYKQEEEQRPQQNHIVPLDQIVSGGPPPDGIASLDNPKFVNMQEAENNFLSDSDLVIGLNVNGDVRAYPLQILVWHEIVNDKVGGIPVAVTYCPLCFTNQVFNRSLNNGQELLQFGTSGKLYNSNLVMYDRTSKSLWSQALGEGIVGKYAGQKLQRIPFDIAYWKDWKGIYPNSKVLSKDTGFSRPYGVDPYAEYYTSNQLYFPVSNHDNRAGLKEKVIGLENVVEEKEQYKAYKLQQIETHKVINDKINGKSVTLFSLRPAMVRAYDRILVEGKVLEFEYNNSNNMITDKQTGTEWNFDGQAINGTLKGRQLTRIPFDIGFWFEWVAFHPQTKLYPS
jgi:hypothetical protein